MRRFVLSAAILGLLIGVPAASAAPPHPVNVTTPMTRNLDGGGYSIRNVLSLETGGLLAHGNIDTDGWVNGAVLVAREGSVILEPTDTSTITIYSGRADPNMTCPAGANTGSLYVQGAPSAALWQQVGYLTTDCDWQRIAP